MKKYLVAVLALALLVVALVGCGSSASSARSLSPRSNIRNIFPKKNIVKALSLKTATALSGRTSILSWTSFRSGTRRR